jgi:PHD/YefM family antitoxin component YafN of YafNO toxin-antitoxin module
MELQVIQDNNGNPAGVLIPIDDWNKLKEQYAGLAALETKREAKQNLLQELRNAMAELTAIEKGELKAKPAKDLLNEL